MKQNVRREHHIPDERLSSQGREGTGVVAFCDARCVLETAVERRELIEYGSETRTITLTSEVIDLLIMEHTKHPKSPLMFMHPATQRPYSPQMVRRMHNEIIKEAGLDHILSLIHI